jgi:P-loop containing NTP hydrolase pore-1
MVFTAHARFCELQNRGDGSIGDTNVPLIIFDECHKAKNLLNESGVPSNMGKAVETLQAALPNAAVLYSSATGISEPHNMVRPAWS